MSRTFDLLVLGTGAGASTVAKSCRQAGWTVGIVDELPYGGTCALRGCDPKRVLLGAAELVDAVRRLRGRGVAGEPARIDWSELMRFKRTFTEPVPERSAVDLVSTSDDFLELDRLPERIVFLGSGFISFELSHLAATAGARVSMLEMTARPLAAFEPDLVGRLVERSRQIGIDVRVETRARAVERRGRELVVLAERDGGRIEIAADMVVHGAGRVPNLEPLDLGAADVAFDAERGIVVNEYMQSVSNPAVYAAGDAAAGGLPLTPVASYEARVAAANLCEGNHLAIDYPAIPSVVFTLPPLAAVGLREHEAREKGLRFRVNAETTSDWYSSRRLGEALSGYKVLVEEDTGRILGAHLLGPRADELVNVFAVAMRARLRAGELAETILAYPTAGSDLAHML
jgi:glutathione reductase (NADPH)